MKNFLNSFLRDESGASAAEYALILVVVGIAIVGGGFLLSEAIGTAMGDAASCIADPGTADAISASCE
jgi:pilus assembly protein Flp/PilA